MAGQSGAGVPEARHDKWETRFMTGSGEASSERAPTSAGRQRTQAGEEARQRAMRAALSAIAELGASKVRMSDIAARAGMSTGHILYHFGRKDRLLLEVLAWSEADLTEQFLRETRATRSPMRKIAKLVEVYMPDHPRDERWALWTQALSTRLEDSESRDFLASLTTGWEQRCAAIVVEGQAAQVFVDLDVDEFVLRSRAMMDGLSLDVMSGAPRWDNASAPSFVVTAMRNELLVRTGDRD